MSDRPAAHRPRSPAARVVLVTGKGGVGKTTIAAGMAELAARTEGEALLVQFGDGESGRRVLASGSRVELVVLEPHDAIRRVVTELLGSRMLAKVLLGNFAVKRLLQAAPAIREFSQLECIRMLAEQRRQRVVVDMPATGHGVEWLRTPAQLKWLLRSGPLYDKAVRLADELISPGRCSVVVVTLPERLVLAETIELCQAMTHEVGLPPSRLVVNRVPAAMPEGALAEARQLAASDGPLAADAAVLVDLLEARSEARGEALEALRAASRECGLILAPLILPELPTDPQLGQVVDWLQAEEQP